MQLELLTGFEAALRCAPELQRHVAPMVAGLDIPKETAESADCAVMCCLRWAARPGLQLTTDEAERLLAAVAALACTICKCGVLQADTAAAAAVASASETAQAAAAGGRAAAAGAAQVLGPVPPGLQDTLLHVAGTCEAVAKAVVAQHAAPSARLHRWGPGTRAAVCRTAWGALLHRPAACWQHPKAFQLISGGG